MKTRNSFTILAALAGVLLWNQTMLADTNACPLADQGETAEDCPWAGYARAIIVDTKTTPAEHLKALAPGILKAVKQDGATRVIRESWGKSINFDELAKDVIVYPPLLETLASTFGVKVETHDNRGVTHAGLEHTFGYLFSVLKTSFGYKRARWVQGEIEAGLELPPGTVGPHPTQGNILTNVTWMLGQIAFRHEAAQLKQLDSIKGSVIPELAAYKFSKLKTIRLEEQLDGAPIVIRTDFIEFPKPQADTHLLVYSILDTKTGHAVIISGFPVAKSFVDGVLNPADLGAGKPIITRYNAYVDGITGKQQTGTRKVTE